MELTEEQQEAVLNFQAITDNWDTSVATTHLISNNWVLEDAVNSFLASNLAEDPVEAPMSMPMEAMPPMHHSPSVPESQSGEQSSFFRRFFSPLIDAFNPTAPVSAIGASRFRSKLANLSSSFPNFMDKPLQEMIELARVRKKLLFIYIDYNDSSTDFYTGILCNSVVVELINSNYLAWGVDSATPDGREAVKYVSAVEVPCFALLRVDQQNPTIFNKAEGYPTLEELVNFFSVNAVNHRQYLEENDPVFQERKIRELQEKEYREAEEQYREAMKRSLEDQANAKQEAERKAREEEIIAEKLRQEEEERKMLQEVKAKKRLEKVGEEPPQSEHTCTISFRNYDGRKLERRFFKTQHAKILRSFVKGQVEDGCQFKLMFGFPPGPLNPGLTLEEAGLYPKAVVHINKI